MDAPLFWDIIDIDEFAVWQLDVRCKGSKRGLIIGEYEEPKKIHRKKAVDYLLEIEVFEKIPELYVSFRFSIDNADPEWIRLKCKVLNDE